MRLICPNCMYEWNEQPPEGAASVLCRKCFTRVPVDMTVVDGERPGLPQYDKTLVDAQPTVRVPDARTPDDGVRPEVLDSVYGGAPTVPAPVRV
ncbi:MAG: hypothetical protein KF858_17385, partial [Candidatus Sumerlaeia bacterium]|nr:hypothetical protein [Candidatus Sumerlaeia bacterium]